MSVFPRRLMPVAEAHQRLVRPGIVVEDGNLDDAGRELGSARAGLAPRAPCISAMQIVGLDHVGIELDLKRGVGRADLGDAVDARGAHRLGDGQALEERLERHLLVAFDEDVLVAAVGISAGHVAVASFDDVGASSDAVSSQSSSQPVWTSPCRDVRRRGRAPRAAAPWSRRPRRSSSPRARAQPRQRAARASRPRRSACRAAKS